MVTVTSVDLPPRSTESTTASPTWCLPTSTATSAGWFTSVWSTRSIRSPGCNLLNDGPATPTERTWGITCTGWPAARSAATSASFWEVSIMATWSCSTCCGLLFCG